MNGLGNDFVIIDERTNNVALDAAHIRVLAARDNSLTQGCDQLLIIQPARGDGDVFMQIFNQDGSEVAACGNGTRAVAAYLAQKHGQTEVAIETLGGLLQAHTRLNNGDHHPQVRMPLPQFDWRDIPLSRAPETTASVAMNQYLPNGFMVNVGNPHAVFFLDAKRGATATMAAQYGPMLETDALFPERANINFAMLVGDNILRLDTWERGVGLTAACGTGACATAIAAIETALVDGPTVTIRPPANSDDNDHEVIHITYRPGEELVMAGPVRFDFDAETPIEPSR